MTEACCTRDEGFVALRRRPAGGGVKPPHGALAEDCGAERCGEIPKASGGTRLPGVPAAGDRVAQTVAAMALEPRTEAVFRDDSYGYRRGKGALGALGRCRA